MLEGIEAFPSLGRGGKAPRLVCGSVSVDSDSRKTLPDRLHVALRSPRFRVLLLLASGLALLVLLRWRESNLESFGTAFVHVRWRWTLAAIAFNLLSAVAGSLAWDTVIKQAMPSPHPRYRDVLSAFAVGLLGNVVLPARAGEVARIAVLARRLGGRAGVWARLVGSGRHERPLVEARGRFRLLATLAREGLGILRAPLPAATATLYQSGAWLSQLLAVFATLRAFGLALPLSAAALVLALVNLAILFPLWPGNVGLLQATVALPLAAYAVDYGHGIAFGVGMQAIEVSVGLSLGLFFLAREGLSVAALKRVPDAGEPSLSARPVPLELEDG